VLEVREFQIGDTEQVERLLSAIWRDKSSYVSYLSRHSVVAFVALKGGELCGFSSLFTNPYHPERDYIGIHVPPEHRHRGIGERLFVALRTHFRRGRKIQTITLFPEAKRFLERYGFLELMRTYEPVLEVDKAKLLETHLPPGYALKILNHTNFSSLEIAQLHAQVYSEQHTWNATAVFDDQTVIDEFMTDVIPEALHLIVFRDQPIAVSSLRGHAPVMDLMWFGVLNSHADHRMNLTRALLNAALEYALTNGVRQIRAELDSLIPEAMIALESLPFEPCEPWIMMISNGI
jgi:GNAT superfamily N-acetyltransferase